MSLWDMAVETTVEVVPPRLDDLLGVGGREFSALPGSSSGGQTSIARQFPDIWLPHHPPLSAGPNPSSPWTGAPSLLDVSGHPSLKMYFEDGATVIELTRLTNYAPAIAVDELRQMQHYAEQVENLYVSMSHGPFSQPELNAAGNPYGFDRIQENGRLYRRRRAVPRYFNGKSIGHAKGVRGSVPNLTVINKQSGKLAQSWSHELRLRPDGISLVWKNDAKSDKGFPYSWALAAGTRNMQAHGPWTYAVLRYLGEIDAEWRKIALNAQRRGALDNAMESILAMSSAFH